MDTIETLPKWKQQGEAADRRRLEHLEALHDRLKSFLLDSFDISDETDVRELGGDLTPLTPLTIGDLKMLMSAVASELENLKVAA